MRQQLARRGGAVRLLQAFDPIDGSVTWVALSRSRPDRAYLLKLTGDGRPVCGCPRFAYFATCPHVEAYYAAVYPAAMLTAKNVSGGDTKVTKRGGRGQC